MRCYGWQEEKQKGEPKNFLYKDITIDYSLLDLLPNDDYLDMNPESFKNIELDSEKGLLYMVARDDQDDHLVNNNTEIGGFLPSKVSSKLEADTINEAMYQNDNSEWSVGTEPFGHSNTEYLASLTLTSLFPDTKGYPANYQTLRSISGSDIESFSEKTKHL